MHIRVLKDHLGDRVDISAPPLAKHVALVSALFGVVLRGRQYLANRSLWLDEALLALNIINRSFTELTRPLTYDQGAPLGFLFAQKIMVQMLGNRDYILRLLPLIAGILACFLMYKLAMRYAEGAGVPLAVGLFALSDQLIYYASEAKQYSSDVLFSSLLLLLICRCLEADARPRHFIDLGLAGALGMWMSHPALFVLAAGALSLIVDVSVRRDRDRLAWVGEVLALWLLSLIPLFFSLRALTSNTILTNYWRDSFMPMPPWRDIAWLQRAFSSMFRNPLGLSPVAIGAIFSTIGCLSLLMKQWRLALPLVAPLLITLLASGIERYPFSGRLLLFTVPTMLLLIAEGVERVHSLLHRVAPSVAFVALVIPIVLLLRDPFSAALGNLHHPDMREHIKPVLSHVSQNKLKSDSIYIYYSALPAFAYYAPQYDLKDADYVVGIMSREQPSKYIEDMDQMMGQDRAWFLFSHNCSWCQVDEKAYFLRHLDSAGTREDAFESEGASTYLYDLRRATTR